MTARREAGEDLDRRVAERVMNWTLCDRRANGWGEGPPVWSTSDEENPTRQDFRPSTDIGAAWAVVEKMRAAGWGFSIETAYVDAPRAIECVFYNHADRRLDQIQHAPTAPLAICLAALASTPAPERSEREPE